MLIRLFPDLRHNTVLAPVVYVALGCRVDHKLRNRPCANQIPVLTATLDTNYLVL